MSIQPDRADPRRTTSFGSLIKRTKSNDILGERERERKTSDGKLRKKSLERERRPSIKDTPPALPIVPSQPVIDTFGGDNYQPRTSMSTNGVYYGAPPVPPLPVGIHDNMSDSFGRAESMTHRSRYSYAQSTSSAVNSPRRVRRRKDPTPYK